MTEPDDVTIEYSRHCSFMSDGTGEKFEIAIYKSAEEPAWILEIVDQEGTSFVWNDRFETEELAYNEACTALNSGERFDKQSAENIEIPEDLLSSS